MEEILLRIKANLREAQNELSRTFVEEPSLKEAERDTPDLSK
jgi:hypothetical protein